MMTIMRATKNVTSIMALARSVNFLLQRTSLKELVHCFRDPFAQDVDRVDLGDIVALRHYNTVGCLRPPPERIVA